jgi:hypothetical protein
MKQKKALKDSCRMWVVAAKHTIDKTMISIFNSSNIRGTAAKDDLDLGSPNAACPWWQSWTRQGWQALVMIPQL